MIINMRNWIRNSRTPHRVTIPSSSSDSQSSVLITCLPTRSQKTRHITIGKPKVQPHRPYRHARKRRLDCLNGPFNAKKGKLEYSQDTVRTKRFEHVCLSLFIKSIRHLTVFFSHKKSRTVLSAMSFSDKQTDSELRKSS